MEGSEVEEAMEKGEGVLEFEISVIGVERMGSAAV